NLRRADVGEAGRAVRLRVAVQVALDGDDAIAAEIRSRRCGDLDELVVVVEDAGEVVVVELVDPRLHGGRGTDGADAVITLGAAVAVVTGAGLELAGRGTAIAIDRVAVVALLAGIDEAVAADRRTGNARLAGDADLILVDAKVLEAPAVAVGAD